MFNLEEYEDVATLNRWFIENYPESQSIMEKNPNFQNQFK